MDRRPDRVYDRGDILELTLDGIAAGLAALAPAAPVHRIHAEAAPKRGQDGQPAGVSSACAVDQYERRACADALVSNRGAMFRDYFFHVYLSWIASAISAAAPRVNRGVELLHQAEIVPMVPELDHLAIRDAENVHPREPGAFAGRRNVAPGTGVRAL